MILLNDKPINITKFNDKTSQVWKLPLEQINERGWWCIVTWNFESEDEFLHLAQLKMLLDRFDLKTKLEIDYLPFARQDKYVTNESTFALRTFSYLLNTLKFDSIMITDPHSDVALQLINKSFAIYPISQAYDAWKDTNSDLICYPDHGALTKYSSMYDISYIHGEKMRNQLTGHIENYKLIGECKDKNVLIVDDICDFGRTFILLTEKLLAAGAKEVNLFVSHGLFTGGIQVLKDAGINKIFTKDGEVK